MIACLFCHAAESAFSGLVLDVLADLGTPVVVPLLPKETAPKLAKWPNPVFIVDDRSFVIAAQFIAAVPGRALKKIVTSLLTHQDEITQALDLLLTGF
ncbi:hypothetical protein A0U89_16200 (plasmid) [Kozakia baliensis]|uniref:Toxin CcdB n=1 Tax=Kozakia baliensis TaxID=153496 RepID=A0A1D8UZ74_9PROT|nr:hypothetical protein A0U89_16200 [Kozakia baliensis]